MTVFIPPEFHECSRFWVEGIECPTRVGRDNDRETDEDEQQRRIAIPVPARKGQESDRNTRAIQDRELVKMLEEMMREIPDLPFPGVPGPRKMPDHEPAPGPVPPIPFPVPQPEPLRPAAFRRTPLTRESTLQALSQHGPSGVMAALVALALSELGKNGALRSFRTPTTAARGLERQLARGLGGIAKGTTAFPAGSGRGFITNETASINALFGQTITRKFGPKIKDVVTSGLGGFFFPGEPQ